MRSNSDVRTLRELSIIKRLSSPEKIQYFLDYDIERFDVECQR
jgi:hypothetical protein